MRSTDHTLINAVELFVMFITTLIIASLFMFIRDANASTKDWLKKCQPFEIQVKSILRSEGVSEDFYYLMVAESRCKPNAVSKFGARGFWQLMPATSKHYGCNDPNNLECSTRAAARYIKSLQSRFKDFESVIAAYNMGGHNYIRIKRKTPQALGLIKTVIELKKIAESMELDNSSEVVLDRYGECRHWYYTNEPEKRNPCINIPDNAKPVWTDQEGVINETH